MAKRSANKEWLRQQALRQQAQTAEKQQLVTERQSNEERVKKLLTKLVQQLVESQGKVQRLALAYADRCARVVDLSAQCRQEWVRAEAAEARVAELEKQIDLTA